MEHFPKHNVLIIGFSKDGNNIFCCTILKLKLCISCRFLIVNRLSFPNNEFEIRKGKKTAGQYETIISAMIFICLR